MRQTVITEFPLYEIREDGAVISNHTRRGMKSPYILKQRLARTGYPYVMLTDGKFKKVAKIHRLLAIYFIPNPLNLPQVNHINSDRADFTLSNLEWVTAKENSRHAANKGNMGKARGTKNSKAKLTETIVKEVRRRYLKGETQVQIAESYNVAQTTIGRIVTGGSWGWL